MKKHKKYKSGPARSLGTSLGGYNLADYITTHNPTYTPPQTDHQKNYLRKKKRKNRKKKNKS